MKQILVNSLCMFFFWFVVFGFLILTTNPSLTKAAGDRWQLLQKSIGISAMHMQLLKNDRVVIFDRTDFGKSNLSLSKANCLNNDLVDCTAHSVEYSVIKNTFRPLFVQTNVWCSSGSAMPDGRLIQTGGFGSGERRVRTFIPCTGSGCDWLEVENGLANRRWYATNYLLPDGRQIIIGGRRQFNYEFYPKSQSAQNVYSLAFLSQTNDPGVENNLYPFVFLNPDGNLFIFANNKAILFDYVKNKVIKTYPIIPGGDPRSYPSTGSAVMLPLKNLQNKIIEAEVLVCGGAPKGSFNQALKGNFIRALKTCARIKTTDPNPKWIMEDMPFVRVMGDMILLPNGHVLLINGAASGCAGWEMGRNPVLNPVIYRPDNAIGSRFETQNPTTIPRMYHSAAILIRDGRVLVGGSNPHAYYNFTNVFFPTELSLEAFNPEYLDIQFVNLRPLIIFPRSQTKLKYGRDQVVRFIITGAIAQHQIKVTMVSPSFNTHSFSMNQRLLVLSGDQVKSLGKSTYEIQVWTPGSSNLASPGYYLLFVVHEDIPSDGIWVQVL